MTKICYNCKTEKPKSEFGVSAIKKDGLNINCKSCRNAKQKLTDEIRRKSSMCIKCGNAKMSESKCYCSECLLRIRKNTIIRDAKKIDKTCRRCGCKIPAKSRCEPCLDLASEKARIRWKTGKPLRRIKHRRKTDVQFKLRYTLRSRLRMAIKNNYKSGSAVNELGCSISHLKSHLESKFKNGMNWSNHGIGSNCWHIDHIVPLSFFDLTDLDQLKIACNYKNLQPLWEKENLSKGSKYERTNTNTKDRCANARPSSQANDV